MGVLYCYYHLFSQNFTGQHDIEGEEEWEVERILNKRKVQGKDKYLVYWKGFTAEGDTWEGKENLENAKELVEEFERKYGRNEREVRWQER